MKELKACLTCGAEFYSASSAHKYCCPGCRPSKMVPPERSCAICGTIYTSRRIGTKWCSAECRNIYNKQVIDTRVKKTYLNICVFCGEEFDSERSAIKYCSEECKKAHNIEKTKYKKLPDYKEAILHYLKDRDGDFCAYCGTKPDKYHIDHYIPISKGGLDRLENYKLSCQTCNTAKSNNLPCEAVLTKTFSWS